MRARSSADGSTTAISQDSLTNFRSGFATNFDKTMKLLRNKDFQQLLVDYPRAKRVFLVAHEVKDEVSSRKLFGKWEKPEDYLEAFAKFVRENANQFEAIRILLKRPQDWNPEALSKLRSVLGSNGFAEDRLKKAHEKVHHALADVISMVKHAADQQAPLLTAEERVTKAVAGNAFSGPVVSDC